MKIDTSKISLSASGQYSETLQMEQKTRTKFSKLYDDQLPKDVLETTSVKKQEKARHQSWYESQTIDTSEQVSSSKDLYIACNGEALFSAYSYFNQKVSNLEFQNGSLDAEKWTFHLKRTQTLLDHSEFAPSLEDCIVPLKAGEFGLFNTSSLLSDSQVSRKQEIIQAGETQRTKIEGNAMAVAKSLMRDSPIYDTPDALLEDIKGMKKLIKKIGDALSALSSGNQSRDTSDGPGFKNTRIDWANLGSSLEQGGHTYIHEKEVSLFRHERDEVSFMANGTVNTSDGQSIDFSLALNFEKEVYQEEFFVQKEEGYVFIDPLVINLEGTIPHLSEAKFRFDLDADGNAEDILMLSQGSGFLCLDKNRDGVINDGRELFGPGTGNGFLELLKYDQDKNFWIDENDDIFDELSFWENDGTGQMQLTTIKDAGIGAIYLASANTPIEVVDDQNNVQARIKKSGIALNENRSLSSVVEMDWLA